MWLGVGDGGRHGQKTLIAPPAPLVLPQNTGLGGAAVSLGNFAVADEDAGILAAALTSAGRETTSSPAHRMLTPARRRFLRREEDDGLAAGTEAGGERRS
ncbi:hypothetical protein CRENBAI_016122 [Crenichthys baileyi]|uniref:Uncharacterized protein n=1 Tax=Crenichthys baileyi TaxID=28760 RepID=A0AAV9R8T0_9TELE